MSTTQTRQNNAWLRTLGIAFALLGLGVAVYMGWAEVTGNATACPGHSGDGALAAPGSIVIDCGFVQKSVYAHIFGIPVALLGVAGYLGILGIWVLEDRIAILREYASMLVFGMALFGFLFSLYLTYTELFIMYTICTWCVASAVLMTLIFIVATVRLVQHLKQPLPV
ncbi:MAG: hypothetical protein Kow0077_18810 [Anaerolineae bacterium]